MPNPINLPLAKLRAKGCKVSTIIGHDPITTGRHPNFQARWHYGITTPTPVVDLDALLYGYNHGWSETFGEAIAYAFRNGRIIMVQATQPRDSKVTTPAQLRAVRIEIERQVATLLDRIATVLPEEG